MKEFMFIFRFTNLEEAWRNPKMDYKQWQDWIGSIAAQQKFVDSGKQLGTNGTVVKPNDVVTNGPYVEIKETLGGYMFVKAESHAEATKMAKGCPLITSKEGSVEVRPVVSPGAKN